jgi:hypothetical protein
MRTMVLQLLGISLARDTDHKSEVATMGGLDSRDGILDDDGPCRFNPQQLCSHQKGIRRGFPCQSLCVDHVAIDFHLEEGVQLGSL